MPEIKSQFFNGKTYSAVDFVESNKNTMKDGILPNTDFFKVLPASNMTIGVTSGRGWVQGHAFSSDSTLSFTLDSADGVLDRIDTVIIRLDLTTDNEKIECKVVKGALGGSATAPVRNGTYYDLVIAQIAVAHGTTAITTAMITDKRGDGNLCGWSGAISADELNFEELRNSKADKKALYQDYLYQNTVVYRESGTWVCPDGVDYITVIIKNGGAGSPGVSTQAKYNGNSYTKVTVCSGGAEGASSTFMGISVTPGVSYNIIIGAGSTGGTTPGTPSQSVGYLVNASTSGGISSAFGYTGGAASIGSYSVFYGVQYGAENQFPDANVPREDVPNESTIFNYKFKTNPKRKVTAGYGFYIGAPTASEIKSHAGYNGYSGEVIIFY